LIPPYTLVEMGSNWVEKEWQTKNHLAEDSDEGAGSDGSLIGCGTRQGTAQGIVAGYGCGLMSQPGRGG